MSSANAPALISWVNHVDTSTLTNNSTGGTESLTDENIKTKQLNEVFRMDFTGSPEGGTLILDIDMGEAKDIGLIAIMGHDMGGLGYTVDIGTSSGGAEIWTSTTSPDNTFFSGTAWDSPNEIIIPASVQTGGRYIRITVPVSTARTCDIGRIWIDGPWQTRVLTDFSIAIQDKSNVVETQSSSVFESERRRVRVLNCHVQADDEDEIRGASGDSDLQSLLTMDLACGVSQEIIMAPYYTSGDSFTPNQLNRQRFTVYGRMQNSGAIQFSHKSGVWAARKRFSIKEVF